MKFFFSFSSFPSYSSIHPSIHPSILYRWQRRRRQYRRTTRFSVASSAAAIVARATHPTFGGKSLLEITNFFLQKIKGGWRFFCYRCSFSSSSTLARIRKKKETRKRRREKMCVKGFNIINLSRLPDGWDRWRQITATNAHIREEEEKDL